METKKQENLIEPKVINVSHTNSKSVDIFKLVKHESKVYILIGDAVMSQKTFRTLKEAEQYVNSKPYELIINTACYAMSISKLKQNEKSK